jgi:hypothetical protein
MVVIGKQGKSYSAERINRMSGITVPVPRFNTLAELRKDLEGWSFASGDENERKYGILLSENFANCERFWKLFVVPLTNRIQGPPVDIDDFIRFKPWTDPSLENIAIAHYSIFMNLVYAHLHLPHPMPSSIENFYVHLASTCDLVESFLTKSYLVLLDCRNRKTEILQYSHATNSCKRQRNGTTRIIRVYMSIIDSIGNLRQYILYRASKWLKSL